MGWIELSREHRSQSFVLGTENGFLSGSNHRQKSRSRFPSDYVRTRSHLTGAQKISQTRAELLVLIVNLKVQRPLFTQVQ
jgi:hypothetical protein